MNLPNFPDLRAETKQAALRSPRTWLAPVVILLLFLSERCPLPEAAALLFISTVVQLAVWYRQWHDFEEGTRRRLLLKHSKQFESELAREYEKNPSGVLKRALKSFQTISATNCGSEQISESQISMQQGMEEQIKAITQIVSEAKGGRLDAPTEETIEVALQTLEKLAAIRMKTQSLKQKQGIAEEMASLENPVDTLKRVSDHLQRQTEVEEEMQKLITRVQDHPGAGQTTSPTSEKQAS